MMQQHQVSAEMLVGLAAALCVANVRPRVRPWPEGGGAEILLPQPLVSCLLLPSSSRCPPHALFRKSGGARPPRGAPAPSEAPSRWWTTSGRQAGRSTPPSWSGAAHALLEQTLALASAATRGRRTLRPCSLGPGRGEARLGLRQHRVLADQGHRGMHTGPSTKAKARA